MKKRILVLVIISFFIISCGKENNTGVITGDNVNLRAEPNTTAKIINLFPVNTRVTIIGEKTIGKDKWVNISFNNGSQKGWVSGQFIKNLDQMSINEDKLLENYKDYLKKLDLIMLLVQYCYRTYKLRFKDIKISGIKKKSF